MYMCTQSAKLLLIIFCPITRCSQIRNQTNLNLKSLSIKKRTLLKLIAFNIESHKYFTMPDIKFSVMNNRMSPVWPGTFRYFKAAD